MDLLDALDADCTALADALRKGDVPKERRRETRELLGQVFAARGDGEAPPAAEALPVLLALGRQVDAMLHPLRAPRRWPPALARFEARWPVRIHSALRPEILDRITETYSRIDARLAKVVDWFWERCKPDESLAKTPTIEEKAASELGEDLELVWGRKKRGPG